MTTLINLLDDASRPRAPRIADASDQDRQQGRRLAMIHQLHLRQIIEVESLLMRIEAGQANLAEAGSAMEALQMVANYRLFGRLCARECNNLTFHHTIEDQELFPILRKGSDGLAKVVDRLSAEHEIIHAVLEKLDGEIRALAADPGEDTFADLKVTFELLARLIRSHFLYEQTELEEALGYYGVPI